MDHQETLKDLARDLGHTDAPSAPTESVPIWQLQQTSASIANIGQALADAQSELENAAKDALNPHFGSKYADITSVLAALRGPLGKYKLAIVQSPVVEPGAVTVITNLIHGPSGEWIKSCLSMPLATHTPQAVGSCITYARRYALQSMLALGAEDDDANSASEKPAKTFKPRAAAAPAAQPAADSDLARKVRELLPGIKSAGGVNVVVKFVSKYSSLREAELNGQQAVQEVEAAIAAKLKDMDPDKLLKAAFEAGGFNK